MMIKQMINPAVFSGRSNKFIDPNPQSFDQFCMGQQKSSHSYEAGYEGELQMHEDPSNEAFHTYVKQISLPSSQCDFEFN